MSRLTNVATAFTAVVVLRQLSCGETASIRLRLFGHSQPVRHIPTPASGTHASRDSASMSWRDAHQASFFVQEPPDRFRQGPDGKCGSAEQTQGFRSLDEVISAQQELWGSRWYNQDLWFADQFRISPLRTHEEDRADIILVPASIAIKDVEGQNAFMETAPTFLPLLDSKPHLLVLSHAASTYFSLKSQLLNHPNAQRFTLVSLNPWHPNHNTSHIISSPQFFHVHWSRGTLARHAAFDAEAIRQRKTEFAVESFQARLPEREVIFRGCMERPDACKHLDYDKEGAAAVWDIMQAAWFVLHPRGDFINRAAWYDTVLANSIPVVFNSEYIKTLPFTDLLDYNRIMELIPIEQLMNGGGPNPIDLLNLKFDTEQALDRLRYIASIKQVFQYLLNPVHELIRFDQLHAVAEEDDAFTMTMKAALRNMCQRQLLPSARCSAESKLQ